MSKAIPGGIFIPRPTIMKRIACIAFSLCLFGLASCGGSDPAPSENPKSSVQDTGRAATGYAGGDLVQEWGGTVRRATPEPTAAE